MALSSLRVNATNLTGMIITNDEEKPVFFDGSEQIKDEIRSLRSSERIELYKWLDHGVVADYGVATDFCPRIGVDRSLEIRHSIEQSSQIHTNIKKI
jgi:hypothetical protein